MKSPQLDAANFGKFSNALLVGNFGDGRINAFGLLTGKWLGNLTRADGSELASDGLWGLAFEHSRWDNDESSEVPRLYFAAGLNSEADGVPGFIRPLEPQFPTAYYFGTGKRNLKAFGSRKN